MDPMNVALIGCGRIADLHARGYARDSRARIHTVCDRDRTLAEQRARQWGAVRFTTDSDEVLGDSNIDAVEILTPQPTHETLAVQALRAGKHVAIQKPMTVDLASADRILSAAERSRRVFKVTENYVFYPPLVRAKEIVVSGRLGEPIGIRIKLIAGPTGGWDVPASAWQWRVQEAAAGRGFITFDHGHHLWSTAWFLMGGFERVSAWIDSIDGVVDAPATVMWKHAGGRRYGTCDLIHAPELHVPSRYYANDEWIEITCSKGLVLVRRCTGDIVEGPVLSVFDGQGWEYTEVPSDWGLGFEGATRNFIDAIRGEAAPMLDAEQAREVLRFALAIQKSSRIRREVYLEELDERLPSAYAWWRRRSERRREGGARWLERLGIRADYSKYAPLARSLTEQLARNFDSRAAAKMDMVISVHLTADAGIEEKLGIIVKGGTVTVSFGELPENATLKLVMPAGVWAAILAHKTRVESALFHGAIRFDGKAEEGLRLRELFGF